MKEKIALLGAGVIAGLGIALAAYQLQPAPPKPVMTVTCYGEGEPLTVKANVAVIMANVHMKNDREDYATLTVAPASGGANETLGEANLFCGITVEPGNTP
jgi:hypothetical protein